MQMFTGWQYLLIDVANNHFSGLDKKTFDERLDWVNANLDRLEEEAEDRTWKERPMYLKACMAVRTAQEGKPTGHMVGFDAICSGIQIMSAISGCKVGAEATGLVDPNRRADAYADCTRIMSNKLGVQLPNMRKHVKAALMTHFYGSKAEPKKEFGDDTPELQAFYEAAFELAPGAGSLLDAFLASWQPFALSHDWVLPDGFEAHVKVMQAREHRIEVDELNHSTFTYVWYENEGEERGVKNAANVVHSIDAYVLRCLVRRCSYDLELMRWAEQALDHVTLGRELGVTSQATGADAQLQKYIDLYEKTQMPDVVILNHMGDEDFQYLSDRHLQQLQSLVAQMLQHKPFEIVTVHDDFKCHPNHMNWLRMHYRNILADLADSTIVQDILTQLFNEPVAFHKYSTDLSRYIRRANYALS